MDISVPNPNPLPKKPIFKPLAPSEISEVQDGFNYIIVPENRQKLLKTVWNDHIYKPINDQMRIDIRMKIEPKSWKVELKTRRDTPYADNLQKCLDFLRAFMCGFDVCDAEAFLRVDSLCLDPIYIEDVKTLKGNHLSRAIGRLCGKGGKTKFTIENATRTRLVIARDKIYIMGSVTDAKVARDALCHLILGSPAGKVCSKLRAITARLAERRG